MGAYLGEMQKLEGWKRKLARGGGMDIGREWGRRRMDEGIGKGKK